MTRKNITLVFVFIAAIYWGIWLGGYIFNATMVAPSWSHDAPVSITNYMNNSHFLAHFFSLVNPWVFLVSLVAWLLARKVDTAARPWLGRAALIAWVMLPLKVWMIIQIGGVFGAARAGTFNSDSKAMIDLWMGLNWLTISAALAIVICNLLAARNFDRRAVDAAV